MDPRSDRVVRRTAMISDATAAYFLLTANYGPDYPNPIKKAMSSSPLSFKDVIFGSGRDDRGKEQGSSGSDGKK